MQAPDIREALSRQEAYPHDTATIRVVETHISWIFLTGRYAYKVKKPVNLGFLDFSTLEKRALFCNEEVRLNRRLCPGLYLDVVPVTCQDGMLRIGGSGSVVDYAVRMKQFDRSRELDRLLAANRLSRAHIESIIKTVAAFHHSIPAADPESEYGLPEKLVLPLLENFRHTEELVSGNPEHHMLERLKAWAEHEHRRLSPGFLDRKAGGFVRHCHGDMHTGNMVWQDGQVMIFDCIEFSPALYMIDVTSDIAFLFMDLEHSGHPELAWRFLSGYLAVTGDYEGIRFVRFYSLYRAMVRAKVTAIRYGQENRTEQRHAILQEHLSYVRQAFSYTLRTKGHLVITCGVSGSGKSTHSARIAPDLQAFHIRSDIERKRLCGIGAHESSRNRNMDIYKPELTEKTYGRLAAIAAICLEEGYPVIVDATFLDKSLRRQFRKLAEEHCCPFTILHFHAGQTALLERVRNRFRKNLDPSEADETVLLGQLTKQEPPGEEERGVTLDIDTSLEVDHGTIIEAIRKRDH